MLRTGRPSEGQRPRRAVEQLLELGQREDPVDAVAQLADLRLVGVEAGGHHDRADEDLDGARARPAHAHVHDVVAEAAGLGHHLGPREDRDRRASLDLGHQRGDQLTAVLAVRVHLPEPADPAAQRLLALHEDDLEADVGQADRGPQAGDPAADDQRPGRRLDHDRLERRGEPGPGDPGPDEAEGLVGGRVLVVAVDPRALLADVDLGVLVGVHAGPGRHAPERVGVKLRRAGGHDQAVEAERLDVLGDLLLARLGAGEHGRPGDHHGLLAERLRGDPLHVDVVGDVAAAMADVDADLAPGGRPTVRLDEASSWRGASLMPAPPPSRGGTVRGGPTPVPRWRPRARSIRRCPWPPRRPRRRRRPGCS